MRTIAPAIWHLAGECNKISLSPQTCHIRSRLLSPLHIIDIVKVSFYCLFSLMFLWLPLQPLFCSSKTGTMSCPILTRGESWDHLERTSRIQPTLCKRHADSGMLRFVAPYSIWCTASAGSSSSAYAASKFCRLKFTKLGSFIASHAACIPLVQLPAVGEACCSQPPQPMEPLFALANVLNLVFLNPV